jgi:hypothetical protein
LIFYKALKSDRFIRNSPELLLKDIPISKRRRVPEEEKEVPVNQGIYSVDGLNNSIQKTHAILYDLTGSSWIISRRQKIYLFQTEVK